MKRIHLPALPAVVLMTAAALLLSCSPKDDLARGYAADADVISIEGVLHISVNDGVARLDRIENSRFGAEDFRISKETANTQTGVRVTFRTNSLKTKILVKVREDGRTRESTFFFGVYCDGEFLADIPGADPVITAPSKGMHEYTVVFPIMHAVDFCGIQTGSFSRVRKAKAKQRPVYVAIGDSITHGTGQVEHGSQISYPFLIAENHDWYLYNLAVGASKITPKIAGELEGIHVDVISIMWGYNDWNQTKGDLEEISQRYSDLLDSLTRVQPEATIYCILPSTAKNEVRPNYQGSLPEVREAERAVAEAFMQTDKGRNIRIIEGYRCNSEDDLSDNVHFSNEGALHFGTAVSHLFE